MEITGFDMMEKHRNRREVFVQCRLQRGSAVTVSWVPRKSAKVGSVVRMKVDGKWTGPWEISEVFHGVYQNGDQLDVLKDAYRHHRERTDI